MKNRSGLRPAGRAVLVRPYEPELGNIMIEIPEVVRVNMQQVEQRAEVIEVGATAWIDEWFTIWGIPVWKRQRAKPGDKVFVTKYAGFLANGTLDGESYRLVNDRDIFCVITEEGRKEKKHGN